ncbi:unnamed protein product [Rhizophagus irregularis]|nr:unnamed protein product [Rhizophagus irregularis]
MTCGANAFKIIQTSKGKRKLDTGLLDEPELEGRQTLRRTWTLKDARLLDEPELGRLLDEPGLEGIRYVVWDARLLDKYGFNGILCSMGLWWKYYLIVLKNSWINV